MDEMANAVPPLLDAQSASKDPQKATTAVFYSISNCQPGLRGVSLGNFLIKNVVDVLSRELPRLKLFCTLSPIPGFTGWLNAQIASEYDAGEETEKALQAVRSHLGDDASKIAADAGMDERLGPVKAALTRLCATYLTQSSDSGDAALDPVARFHLNNGAKMERINWLADRSKKGLRDSLGLMVNYLYEPKAIEGNHQKYVDGEIVASRRVRGLVLDD